MIFETLKREYFNWMCDFVCPTKRKKEQYKELLWYLFNRDFEYIIDLDSNRAYDGLELRQKFDDPDLMEYLYDKPCSILEMMVALSIRCEVDIMDNPDDSDRTNEWFWGMIENLGLGRMTNSKYDDEYVEQVIDRFLNREYEENGEGGLFTVNNRKEDLRCIDIWYQMNWYLNELIENE